MSEEEKCHEWIDSVMEQAQVFASAWSLVGSPFDAGYALETADAEKASLRAMLESAWNRRQQVPDGWREFIENIATVGSEPLNSAVVYRALASRRHFMAELRNKARELLAEAPKPEDVK